MMIVFSVGLLILAMVLALAATANLETGAPFYPTKDDRAKCTLAAVALAIAFCAGSIVS